jgi:hypothetical protein
MTPARCQKCHGSAILTISIRQFETLEEEHKKRCLDCGHTSYSYIDMTDAEEIRDTELYIEIQREERGDY